MKYFSDITVKAIIKSLKLKNNERVILIVDNREADLVNYLTYDEGGEASIDTVYSGLREICMNFFKKNQFDKSQAIYYLELLFNSFKTEITQAYNKQERNNKIPLD